LAYKQLNAAMGTDAFPENDVGKATKNFVGALGHLANVLWQDLAVRHPNMKGHRIFTVSPFADNSFGWITYRDNAHRILRNERPKALEIEASARTVPVAPL